MKISLVKIWVITTSCFFGVLLQPALAQDTSDSSASLDLSVTKIMNEYNVLRNKRIAGAYGDVGAEVMKNHQITMANHLAIKVNATECHDLQKHLPNLDTGYYIFKSSANLSTPTSQAISEDTQSPDIFNSLYSLFNLSDSQINLTPRNAISEISLVRKLCISHGVLIPVLMSM